MQNDLLLLFIGASLDRQELTEERRRLGFAQVTFDDIRYIEGLLAINPTPRAEVVEVYVSQFLQAGLISKVHQQFSKIWRREKDLPSSGEKEGLVSKQALRTEQGCMGMYGSCKGLLFRCGVAAKRAQ